MKNKQLIPVNLQLFGEGEEGSQTQFGFEDFKTFVESNEDAQKFIQSQTQSVADKQLESWKANNLDKIKQEMIKSYEESKNNKTPEQIELEQLKAVVEEEKAKRVTSENKTYVATQLSNLSLDEDLKETVSDFMLNNLVSADTEFTQNAVEAFTGVLSTINEKHAEAIKSMEMNNAFGNKNQQQQQTGSEQEIKDPMALLGESLGKLNI
ncbi:capsid assembly scaffolding protein Gp46 family protein [Vagococcus sp. JNUCC 83]